MTEEQSKGRRTLLGFIVVSVLISIGVIVAYNIRIGPKQLPQQGVRLLLTLILFAALYQGSAIAKWISVVLFTIGGALMAPTILHESWTIAMGAGLMSLVYLIFARTLIWDTNVNSFLQRHRSPTETETIAPSRSQETQ